MPANQHSYSRLDVDQVANVSREYNKEGRKADIYAKLRFDQVERFEMAYERLHESGTNR